VLSLDAPAVALSWQALFARSAGVTLHGIHAVLLGGGVWMIYAADRWLEGWRLDPEQVQTQRHYFYHRWRWPVLAVGLVVLAAVFGAACRQLDRRDWLAGLLLLAPVLAYLLSHQWLHRHHPWRVPKEVCVAVLFTVGCAFFTLVHQPAAGGQLAVLLGLFALLCFANCTLIAAWEREVDVRHGQTSWALQFPRGRVFSRWLPWVIAGVAGLAAGAGSDLCASDACAAASGLLLGLLDLAEPVLGRELARAVADATLLTPLVALWLR
jgi:hypothetical protein